MKAKQIRFQNAAGTVVTIRPEPDERQALFEIKVDGLVTWPELEALAGRLHPPGLTAQGHATLVRDADTWRRGPDPEDFDDGEDDPAYVAAVAAGGVFPLVDEHGYPHDDADYVPCPTCHALAGDACKGDGLAEPHPARAAALARFMADPDRGFGDA